MTFVEKYANFDLTTGNNDGTSEANAWQTWAAVSAGISAGDRVNIKQQSSPFVATNTITITDVSLNNIPVAYRGYQSTIGDGGMWKATISTGGIGGFTFAQNTESNYVFENMEIIAAPTSNLTAINLGYGYIRNCVFKATTVRLNGASSFNSCFGCAGTYSSKNISTSASFRSSTHTNSVFHLDVSTTSEHFIGGDEYAAATVYKNCIFHNDGPTTTVSCLQINRAADAYGARFIGCRFNGWNKAIDIPNNEPAVNRERITIKDCIFTDCEYAVFGAGITTRHVVMLDNYYYQLTSGFTNYPAIQEVNNTALGANPYVDVANKNFGLNQVSNGGQLIRNRLDTYGPLNEFLTDSRTFAFMHEDSGGGGGSPVTRSWWG